MFPDHRRRTQIIRLLAGGTLAALTAGSAPVFAQDRPTACVSCLVLALDRETAAAATGLQPGSLAGIQVLVGDAEQAPILESSGARVAVLVAPRDSGPA